MKKRKKRTIKLGKPLADLSDEELEAVAITIPPNDNLAPHIVGELRRRRLNLLASAPSQEVRELMEEAMKPETFNRFLDETGNRAIFEEIQQHIRHGNLQEFEQVVQAINEQEQTDTKVYAQDVWDLYPVWVEARGEAPQLLSDKAVYEEYYMWLVTNNEYQFHRVVGDDEGTKWLKAVINITVKRRIFEWKYIQLTEHGNDTFADPAIRDMIVSAIQEGRWLLGQ